MLLARRTRVSSIIYTGSSLANIRPAGQAPQTGSTPKGVSSAVVNVVHTLVVALMIGIALL